MSIRIMLIWGVVAAALVVLFTLLQGPSAERSAAAVAYSDLLERVDAGRVESVRTQGTAILFRQHGDANDYVAYVPEGAMADTIRRLYDAGVRIEATRPRSGPTFGDLLLGILPMALLIGAWFFFMRQMRKQGEGPPRPD